jgi:hypothetical protein
MSWPNRNRYREVANFWLFLPPKSTPLFPRLLQILTELNTLARFQLPQAAFHFFSPIWIRHFIFQDALTRRLHIRILLPYR